MKTLGGTISPGKKRSRVNDEYRISNVEFRTFFTLLHSLFVIHYSKFSLIFNMKNNQRRISNVEYPMSNFEVLLITCETALSANPEDYTDFAFFSVTGWIWVTGCSLFVWTRQRRQDRGPRKLPCQRCCQALQSPAAQHRHSRVKSE